LPTAGCNASRVRAWPVILFAIASPAGAENTVIQAENVRTDYAQVLRVEPVFQTLRATRMEQQCVDAPAGEGRSLSRIVGAVKGVLKPSRAEAPGGDGDCRTVPVEREFRRPIAYDVDYMYKGGKYRSRLPYDPGHKLRLRVSVTPYVPPAGER
jgi:uncharacterized protein YcfJ